MQNLLIHYAFVRLIADAIMNRTPNDVTNAEDEINRTSHDCAIKSYYDRNLFVLKKYVKVLQSNTRGILTDSNCALRSEFQIGVN